MTTRTLQQFIDEASRQFAAMRTEGAQEATQQTGLELCRMVAVLASGLMSNSVSTQRSALENARHIANERESLSGTDGEVDRDVLGTPLDIGALAVRLLAVENQLAAIEAFVMQLLEGADAKADTDG